MNSIQTVHQDILDTKTQFEAVLCDQSISFNREANFAIQILESSDFAMGVAKSNRQSVANAVTNVAAIGLSLNPATKYAYLVPRKGGICLDISYIGLVKLATDSGSVRWVKAELVYEADQFSVSGFGQAPNHTFSPFAKERGAVVGVYCVAKTSDGDYLTDTMSIEEVHAIRNRSEAWVKKQSGPWKTDPGEMTKKTLLKRASKLWPKTERLDQAMHYLNTDGGEGIDFQASPVKTGFDLETALAMVPECSTRGQLDEVFAIHGGLATKAKDRAGWKALKEACSARNKAISEEVTDVEVKDAA